MTALNKQAIDFSQPLETESGEPVKYICHDVIEYKCARVCVDSATGIVYSSPHTGLKIRNKEASPRAKLREQIESAADAYWQFDNGWISDMKCGELSHEYLLFVKEPKNVLALLDENLQLQREKDAMEAVALALRDDMRQAREQLEAAEKRNAEQQRSLDHRKFLLLSADEVQRDFAEALGCAGDNESIMEAIDDLKQHIAELESKNSNLRTIAHEQNELAIRANLDSINDAVEMDRLHKRIAETDQRNAELTARIEPMDRRIAELEAKLETADKLQDVAFRDGLKAGFSYGQTDDQSGFTQCMSAYSPHAGIKVKGE